jgi:hypothetical protein
LVGANLFAFGDMDECYWNKNITGSSFNNSFGFSKMLTLFQPDITKIEVV